MFKDLKLKTVTLLLILILGGVGSILIYGMWSIQNRLLRVDDLWHQYQVDRSEKPRLQSNLRKAIGYGGMIHNFKNYIIRHDPHLLNRLHENFGAARATLAQYSELNNSSVEQAAIQDILSVIKNYELALKLATPLVNTKTSIKEIDKKIKVDDKLGLRALSVLQNEIDVQENSQLKKADLNRKRIKSKGRLISNLRATIGYGGMIHKFKNYVIRQEPEQVEEIESNFQNVWNAIKDYHAHDLNSSEKQALEDISQTMKNYHANIIRIHKMISQKKSAKKIDKVVIVDDAYALLGFSILEKQISLQTAESATEVNATLHKINSSINRIGATILSLLVSMIFLSLWLMLKQIIKPVKRLTNVMTDLANDQLDIKIQGMESTNEIGAMARAVNTFKENSLRRKAAEDELGKSNLELNKQIDKVERLRLNAQEQASNAMSLAENLSDARVAAENARSQAESEQNKIQIILDTVQDGIISADENAKITSFNPAAEAIFGYMAKEVIGENVSILMPTKMRPSHKEFFKGFLQGSKMRAPNMTVEQVGQHKNGRQFPIEIKLNSMKIDGQLNFTTVIRDITERKAAEEEINRLAMSDPLTGLANRNQFQQRLREAIHMADRHKEKFVLMMMDLDKFKPVNDQYGHLIGDDLLVNIAKKLNTVFRAIDTVARFGGDEFAVIVTALHKNEDALPSIKRILASMAEPIDISGNNIDIGISIGISVYPDDSADAESLINLADKALYIAKEQQGNSYHFYNSTSLQVDNK